MNFLLSSDQEEGLWHHRPSWWGKGFVMADHEGGRWDKPLQMRVSSQGLKLCYEPLQGLLLEASRTFGAHWTENYRLVNRRKSRLEVGSFAVSTPFRDVYQSAPDSLARACHAHLWTGGAHSYAWAWPMKGKGPGLGLALKKGELWAYSIESRNQATFSNIRGHIYLHATDAARSPEAFGGQPKIFLKPGQALEIRWQMDWHEAFASFEKTLRPGFEVPELYRSAFRGREGVQHQDFTLSDGRRSRVAVLFHRPLRNLCEARASYILRFQQAKERDDSRKGSFLPYDTQWKLSQLADNWDDWSDGRERVAMALLLQHLVRLGWGQQEPMQRALERFHIFARTHLIKADGVVWGESFHSHPNRLYNFPWLAEYQMNRFGLTKDSTDAQLAGRILAQYYRRGGRDFLAFWDCTEDILKALDGLGQGAGAASLRKQVLDHADHFARRAEDLPRHEVNYEQSMVAPLLLICQTAQRLQPTRQRESAIRRFLPWLKAFACGQPHARLRHIPIRHWDGYWFGRDRHWGDVFPHYWSVLSAAVFANAARMGMDSDGGLRAMARDIFKANLASFHPDGSATCAFVFPSCVNGNPAHNEDPLANDQDWALVWSLKYPELW
jgi:hypothetical protein